MACLGCSCSTGSDTTVKGCKSGGCSTGGCNKRNTFDYLTAMGAVDSDPFDLVEVSFKNGARKDFFRNPPYARASTGDWVMVESGHGFDIGRISLTGDLVKLQMKKKRVKLDYRFAAVMRKANERDMERYHEIRSLDQPAMVAARAITRMLNMKMKVSDVEFQADGRKAMFIYTAEGRIDFRELIRHFAKEFKVKIEMRQIGARQETARLGGLGPCGRELCCSTWLTDFKSVNTSAARYQNIAINQSKLSGQCGRLKCCLNYELDTYIEALDEFPDKAEKLHLATGRAFLIKTDVFKRLMYYSVEGERSKLYVLTVDAVKDIMARAKKGEKITSLEEVQVRVEDTHQDDEPDYDAINDVIDLPLEERKKRKKKKKPSGGSGGENRPQQTQASGEPRPQNQPKRPENPQNRPQNQQNRPPRDDQRGPRPDGPPPQKRRDDRPRGPRPDGENRPPRPDGPPPEA